MPIYQKPPVVEAVIQLQFLDGLSDRDIERTAKKAESHYPVNSPMKDFKVEVRVAGGTATPGVSSSKSWSKLSSRDGAEVLVINRDQFTVAKLAPYATWDELYGRFTRDYELIHGVVGFKRVGRIGVRFINRLDVPVVRGERFDVSRYLNVYPYTPHISTNSMLATQLRFEHDDSENGVVTIVSTGTVDPVLINHHSYLLDIDVVKTQNIPMKREDVVANVDSLRRVKNKMFETLVTDAAREIFNA